MTAAERDRSVTILQHRIRVLLDMPASKDRSVDLSALASSVAVLRAMTPNGIPE